MRTLEDIDYTCYDTVRNLIVCRSEIKYIARQNGLSNFLHEELNYSTEPTLVIITDDIYDVLDRIIGEANVTEESRMVIRMLGSGLSAREVALLTGRTMPTMNKMIERTVKKINEYAKGW